MIPEAAIDVPGYEPSDAGLHAEYALGVAVLTVAIGDLKSCNKRIRAAAMEWFKGPIENLQPWCELLNLDSEMVRKKALPAIHLVWRFGKNRWAVRSGARASRAGPMAPTEVRVS